MERPITNVVVLGSGEMGKPIAYRVARHRIMVTVIEREEAVVRRAEALVAEWAARDFAVEADRLAVLGCISFVVADVGDEAAREPLAGAHLVIEALPEERDLKSRVLTIIDGICDPEAIFGSNSSSYKATEIDGGCVRHRGRTMNIHFVPEPRRSVELMCGTGTEYELLLHVAEFLRTVGLMPFCLRGQSRGFLFNRIWHMIKREALKVVAEGVACVEDVDRIWMLCLGSKAGPFGSVIHHLQASRLVTVTLAFQGASFSSTALICSKVSSGS